MENNEQLEEKKNNTDTIDAPSFLTLVVNLLSMADTTIAPRLA